MIGNSKQIKLSNPDNTSLIPAIDRRISEAKSAQEAQDWIILREEVIKQLQDEKERMSQRNRSFFREVVLPVVVFVGGIVLITQGIESGHYIAGAALYAIFPRLRKVLSPSRSQSDAT